MFDVLRVPARYGRTFGSGDDQSGRDAKVVLTDRFWRRAFGGDPTIVGRRISLSGAPYTVIGVMPPGFTLGWNEDLFVPLTLSDELADPVRARKQHYLHVFGRLAPNVTMNAARADLSTIARRLEAAYPAANTGRTVALVTLRDDMTGSMQRPLVLLQAAALMVLLIACANLRTSRSRVHWAAGASWRCAPRSAPVADGWPGNCSPSRCSSPQPVECSASSSHWWRRGRCSPSTPTRCRRCFT